MALTAGNTGPVRQGHLRSQVERKFVEVHIARDSTNFRAEAGNLICEHARCGDLDGIIPVVVVVAEGIGEV